MLMIIIPIKWLFRWEYTLFSQVLLLRLDKPRDLTVSSNPTWTDLMPSEIHFFARIADE